MMLPLADGRDHPVVELCGGEAVETYACTSSGRVLFGSIRVVRGDSCRVQRLVLDEGAALTLARDSAVMVRDGSYAPSSQLLPNTSLMPLYTKQDRDGYVLVQQNYSGRYQKAHWLVARSGLLGVIPRFEAQRTIIHHRNFEPSDNRSSNLEFMGDRDHTSFHRSLAERNEHWQSPEFEACRVAALARKASTAEGRAYFAARGTRNIVKYMTERRDEFLAAVAGNGKRGAAVLAKYNQSEQARARSREAASRLYECETCGEKVKSYIGLHNHRRWRHGYNHRVLQVETVRRRQQTFCVLATRDNFGVAPGIFVRACGSLDSAGKTSVANADRIA